MGTTGFSELFIIGEVQQGVDLSISRGSEGFSCGSVGKESACNTGDLGSIPGLGRSLEKGKATHSSILAWRIPWTLKSMGLQSQTQLSDFLKNSSCWEPISDM